jgi:hypothetical protein
MTNYKNKTSKKSINDSSMPLFEECREDKTIKSAPKLDSFNLEPESKNLKTLPSRTSNAVATTNNSETKIEGTKKARKSSASGITSSQTAKINHIDSLMLSLGIYLQEARVKAGYSLNQVAMITKLNIHYIEALERDDFKNTPPLIYVKAYIKKLSSLYKIDTAQALNLLNPTKNNDKKLSDSIFQDLQETKQTNKKDEEKIKIISKISVVIFVIIIFMGCVSGLFFWLSGSKATEKALTASEKAIMIKNMEKLIAPQSIVLTELPVNLKR